MENKDEALIHQSKADVHRLEGKEGNFIMYYFKLLKLN